MNRYWWNLSSLKQKIIIACCCAFILTLGSISYGIFFTRVDANYAYLAIFIVSNWGISYAVTPYLFANYVLYEDAKVIRRTVDSTLRNIDLNYQTLSRIKYEIDELIESIGTDFWVKYTVDDFNCFDEFGFSWDSQMYHNLYASSLLECMLAYEHHKRNIMHEQHHKKNTTMPEYIIECEIASYFLYIPLPMAKMYLDILGFNDGTMSEGLKNTIKECLRI